MVGGSFLIFPNGVVGENFLGFSSWAGGGWEFSRFSLSLVLDIFWVSPVECSGGSFLENHNKK